VLLLLEQMRRRLLLLLDLLVFDVGDQAAHEVAKKGGGRK
jgi:hypothetical protein